MRNASKVKRGEGEVTEKREALSWCTFSRAAISPGSAVQTYLKNTAWPSSTRCSQWPNLLSALRATLASFCSRGEEGECQNAFYPTHLFIGAMILRRRLICFYSRSIVGWTEMRSGRSNRSQSTNPPSPASKGSVKARIKSFRLRYNSRTWRGIGCPSLK